MKLSVVIPAYNEEKDIAAVVKDVHKTFRDAEIIVVNDASTDKTLEILVSLRIPTLKILTNEQNRGHGYSVVHGLRAATGDYIVYIDADRQIELGNLHQLTNKQYDFVSGWRINRQDKLFRKITSFCLKSTILLRFGYFIRDANCPFKLYRREVLLPLLKELPESYVIPIACLEVLARKHKLVTVTIPTPHKPYEGVRQGFLQLPNATFFKFIGRAFMEMVSL